MSNRNSRSNKRKHLKDTTNTSNKSNTSNTSFLKTEPETTDQSNGQKQNQSSQIQNIKQKELDEIMLKYLNIKTKLNNLWNKLD